MQRIGGEFEISIEDYLLPNMVTSIDDIYSNKRNHLYFDTGRSALYVALQDIIQRKGKKVAWLPIYTCSSVILPFRLLGFEIHFYSMGFDLQSPNKFPDKLDGETFLFIHYFGVKNEAIIKWLTEMKKNNKFFIIEDCVHALFTDGVGHYGDYVINSFRKFLAVPDGAMLSSTLPITDVNQLEPNEGFISRKIVGKLLRQYSAEDAIFLRLFAEAEKIIDSDIIPRKMSWISKYLFGQMDLQAISQKRRYNWLILKEILETGALKKCSINPLFNVIHDGEVPLGFPIIINNGDRDKLQQHLASKNIFCPIHWPLMTRFYNNTNIKPELRLSESILTLPIDQRIDQKSLEYMAEQILDFYTNN